MPFVCALGCVLAASSVTHGGRLGFDRYQGIVPSVLTQGPAQGGPHSIRVARKT